MRRDHVVVRDDVTFSLYGDELRGYYLEVWENAGDISQRVDIPLGSLSDALRELEAGMLVFNRDKIRP